MKPQLAAKLHVDPRGIRVMFEQPASSNQAFPSLQFFTARWIPQIKMPRPKKARTWRSNGEFGLIAIFQPSSTGSNWRIFIATHVMQTSPGPEGNEKC